MARKFVNVSTNKIITLFLRANRAFIEALESGKSEDELKQIRQDVHDFGEEIKLRSDIPPVRKS